MPCYNCDGTPVVTHPRDIGPFPGVVQIVAPFGSVNHELLTNPNFADTGGNLIDHGGPKIVGGRTFNVYLGQPANPNLDAFAAAASASFYLSPDGADASPSQFIGSMSLPQNPLPVAVDDGQIQAWIDQEIAGGVLPKDDGKTIYFIIMPTGSSVSITFNGQAAHSCSDFCGYHSMTSGGHYYAVICDNSCPGCHGGFTVQEAQMMIWVHEYVETRSDPQGNAWYDSQGAENGDKCAWIGSAWLASYFVQPEWVNVKSPNCYVPAGSAPPPPPPVNVTTGMGMASQPVSVKVGDPSAPFSVSMLLPNGSVNTADNSTLITAVLNGFSANFKTVAAVQGVATFPAGIVAFQNPHTGLWWNLSAGALPAIHSGLFDVTAGAPPPPPPPTRTYEQGYADGYAAAKAKAVAVIAAI